MESVRFEIFVLFAKICNTRVTFSVICLDAKMRFDDNADFRQSDVFSYRDWTQENAQEVEAAKFNLNYIALDGILNIVGIN